MWNSALASWVMLGCVIVHAPCLMAGTIGDCIALEFVSSGCPKCNEMNQSVETALEYGWVARRIEVNADPYTAQRWRIHSTPTTLLIRDGREVDRILGPIPFEALSQRMLAASSQDRLKETQFATPMGVPLQSVQAIETSTPWPESRSPSPTADPIRSAVSSPVGNPKALAQSATVRIRIDEPEQQAVGTGTIIDNTNGEALVMTCGHLFRNLGPNARVLIELFEGNQAVVYPAQVIDFQADDPDIGLLSFRPGRPVPSVPLKPSSQPLREGESVFSLGCDHGQDPTRRDTRITKLNRYQGAPNVEIAGMPVQGRSGGGLFNQAGELIGVCNAADSELDEGLYSGPEVLYQQIAKLGLDRLYDRKVAPSVASKSITVIVREANGGERHLQIQDPSPALLQAIHSEGYAVAR